MPRLSVIALSSFVVCLALSAATAQTTKPESDHPILKTYDIGDLIRKTQDFPSPHNEERHQRGGSGEGGGNIFGTSSEKVNPGLAPTAPRVFQPTEFRSSEDEVENLCQLITDFVEPESWRINGGLIGSISEMRGVLFISQTPSNHERIADLITKFRELFPGPKSVCVRAYWLTLSAAEAETLLGKGQPAPLSPPVIPDELLDAKHVYAQGQTTCFDRQAVHLFSGREQTVVEDVNPVVGTNVMGFDPEPETRLSGAELQLRPEIAKDQKSIVIDVASVITEREGGGSSKITEVRSAGTQPVLAEFDRVNLIKQQFQTTLRIPTGKKVLVGGMTIEPSKLNGQQLYLVLEVSPLSEK